MPKPRMIVIDGKVYTPDQLNTALKLLKSIVIDVESMRAAPESNFFGPFSEYVDDLDTARIGWPNLSILSEEANVFLKEIGL